MILTSLNTQFRTIFVVFTLLLTTTTANSQVTEGMSHERLNRIDATMQEYVDNEKLSGAVLYVTRNGKEIYHSAFGYRDVAANDPMENSDMFRIASQSKAITSVAIMMLQEQGKLLIGDPVSKYLPEYMKTTVAVRNNIGGFDVVAANQPITIRDLLTHTAGIDYGFGAGMTAWRDANIQGWYFADRDEPIRETVRRIASLPQAAQPGEAYVYGYNTDILGAVVEVVSGKSLDEFFREYIFTPLAMNDTYFYVPEDKRNRVATVYSLKGDSITLADNPGMLEGGSHVGQGHYMDGPRKSYSGGAGLVSTARDYGRFLQMLLNGGTLDGNRILSRTTINLMVQNHIGDLTVFGGSGSGFGLGFLITTDVGAYGQPSSEGNYGWGGAYHSTYWVDPVENLVIVYLTQLIPAGGLDDQAKIRALIYQAIVD